MRIDHSTLLFLDSSCLIAASGSPTGGSGFLLALCGRQLLRAAVSQPVLLEAERNIVDNIGLDALTTYHRLLAKTPMTVVPVPDEAERAIYRPIVGEKDDHVVAAGIAAKAPFLITLDQKLARRVNDAVLAIRALAPGEFITGVLPAHRDFPSLRE